MKSELKPEILFSIQKDLLFQVMLKLQTLVKINAPVDTGRLRNSIKLEPIMKGAITYTVSDGVDYGVHQEYGTIKMMSHPFFRPALDEVYNYWIPKFWNDALS